MRALSIRQPWAWAIVSGYKSIENRTWRAHHRGPLLIHAGKGMTRKEFDDFLDTALAAAVPLAVLNDLRPENLPRGGIVGQARLVDCVTEHPSRWFFGPYGFVLDEAKPLPFRPCPGALGFFELEEAAHGR